MYYEYTYLNVVLTRRCRGLIRMKLFFIIYWIDWVSMGWRIFCPVDYFVIGRRGVMEGNL